MTARRGAGEAGMTLVEVLVFVVLLGFLTSIVLAGTRIGNQAWTRAERQTNEAEDTTALQGLLRRTIAAAVPAFASTNSADPRIAFDGEPDNLTLVAPEPGAGADGEWSVLRLHVAQHGAGRALLMSWHVDLPASDGSEQLPERESVLLEHVAGLRLEYFGFSAEQGVAMWLDRWAERDRLPQLIRIRLERDGPRFAPWPEVVVRTRVTTNVACAYSALDTRCHRMP